jgi:hypothetical protein
VGGCIADDGSATSCTDGHGLIGAAALAISPDGKNAYVAAGGSGALAVLKRDSGGAITQPAGTLGCVSDTGSSSCADGTALAGAQGVTLSPDGRNVYVASGAPPDASDSLTIFDREADLRALQVVRTGAGKGTVSGPGIKCPADCAQSYPAGTKVTLTAVAAAGSTFAGWGGACSGKAACQVTMSQLRTVTAKFDVKPPDTKIAKSKIKQSKHKATFTFKGSGGTAPLAFQCKLDGKSYASCSPPKTYKNLKTGKHTFRVRAKDSKGELDPSPAKQTFTIG